LDVILKSLSNLYNFFTPSLIRRLIFEAGKHEEVLNANRMIIF